MSRLRQLTLLAPLDSARLAVGFPRTAWYMVRDTVAGSGATPFPRRIGIFLTNRCDFARPMYAVQDARDKLPNRPSVSQAYSPRIETMIDLIEKSLRLGFTHQFGTEWAHPGSAVLSNFCSFLS